MENAGLSIKSDVDRVFDYVSGWTVWNHVRTVASLAAAAALTIALVWDRH